MALELAPSADLRAAREDWLNKAYHPASRDKQLAFAMVTAAIQNQQNPLAEHIAKIVRHMR